MGARCGGGVVVVDFRAVWLSGHHVAEQGPTGKDHMARVRGKAGEDGSEPGTGIAPFRGFLQERCAASDTEATHLYFGCRSEHAEYISRDELEIYMANQTLASLNVAFSGDTTQKIYVQDLLRRPLDAARLWKLVDHEDGMIFVCGDAKNMASAVAAAIEQVLAEQGSLDKESAANYVAHLKSSGRYLQNIW